jgi:hypothetical protein
VHKISIFDATGAVALGASVGQDAIRLTLENLRSDPTTHSRVILSFEKIKETNASFVKATLLYFFNCGRLFATGGKSESKADDAPTPIDCFAAIMGCSDEVRDEVEDVFSLRQLPYLEVTGLKGHEWISGNIRGHLDKALIETFKEVVVSDNGTTAAMLRGKYGTQVTGTAWNNRLEALHQLRLVRRTRRGREWNYEALTKETKIWVSGSSSRKPSVVS